LIFPELRKKCHRKKQAGIDGGNRAHMSVLLLLLILFEGIKERRFWGA
jgi:hypothetical protein